jgi:helicase
MEGQDPSQIIKILEDKYGISAYQGDVFGYLDDAVRNLDAVELIARVHSRKEVAENAKKLKKKVQG